MFDLITLRKGAAAVGIVDEVEEVEEVVDDGCLTSFKPMEPFTKSFKELNGVRPVILDPQEDLNNLVELFGLIQEPVKVFEMSCPECGDGFEAKADDNMSFDMDITCPTCEHDDEAGNFYESTDTKYVTSRTPTDEELDLVIPNWRFMSKVHLRKQLLDYYLVLSNQAPLLPKGAHSLADPEQYGYDQVHCNQRCVNDNCTCVNSNLRHLGKIKSLSAELAKKRAKEEAADSDLDDDYGQEYYEIG